MRTRRRRGSPAKRRAPTCSPRQAASGRGEKGGAVHRSKACRRQWRSGGAASRRAGHYQLWRGPVRRARARQGNGGPEAREEEEREEAEQHRQHGAELRRAGAHGRARREEAKGPAATTFSVLVTKTSVELQQCGQELLARQGGARRLREWRGGRGEGERASSVQAKQGGSAGE